nr:hypothetical protein Iba_chr07eCG7610 [Ipomoea batatas]
MLGVVGVENRLVYRLLPAGQHFRERPHNVVRFGVHENRDGDPVVALIGHNAMFDALVSTVAHYLESVADVDYQSALYWRHASDVVLEEECEGGDVGVTAHPDGEIGVGAFRIVIDVDPTKLVLYLTWLVAEFSLEYFFFSSAGSLKNRKVAALAFSSISMGIPWFTIWKKPLFSAASQMSLATFGSSQFETSMTGMESSVTTSMLDNLSSGGWTYWLGSVWRPSSERPFTPWPCFTTKSLMSERTVESAVAEGIFSMFDEM